MEFFKQSDLDYFSSVIGKRFNKGDSQFDEIGRILTQEGVYAKTGYWADLVKQHGYPIEISYYWQISGVIRRYTWARIYLRGYEGTYIYYTIGVGSRLTKDRDMVTTLEYKLDCQRNKLSEYQIKIFDDYLLEILSKYPWETIEINSLEELDWDKLLDITLSFIEDQEEHYKASVNLVWPSAIGATPKIARLCWNTFQWEKPSGAIGKSKSTAESIEKDKGYGYEEWLFDTSKTVDGYHYGFIQAFNKSKHEGKTYDLHLYSIRSNEDNSSSYYWVGRIYEAEVLTIAEMEHILGFYKKQGWYDAMLSQLKPLGIHEFNYEPIREEYIFNVKFKVAKGSYERFDPPRIIDDDVGELGKNRHYVLLEKPSTSVKKGYFNNFTIKGGNKTSGIKELEANYSVRSYQKVLLHKEMQDNIYEQLYYKYNNAIVGTEEKAGYGKLIDLAINLPNVGNVFYEIKTGPNALSCIREALGQIIEYCYYPSELKAEKLIIVSPHNPTSNDQDYLRHLRNRFEINLYYQKYSLEKKLLEETLY